MRRRHRPGAALLITAAFAVVLAVGVAVALMGGRDSSEPEPSSAPLVQPTATDVPFDYVANVPEVAAGLYIWTRPLLSDPKICSNCADFDLRVRAEMLALHCGKQGIPEGTPSPAPPIGASEPLRDVTQRACAQVRQAVDAGADEASLRALFLDILKRLEPALLAVRANAAPTATPVPFPVPLATPTRPPAPPPGLYPLGTHVGVAAIDQVLDLIYAERTDTLADEAFFAGTPCIYAGFGIGIVECDIGEPEGTIYRTFSLGSCSPGFTFSRDSLYPYFAGAFAAQYVSAVYEVALNYAPERRYLVLLRRTADDSDRQVFIDSNGRLVATYVCGQATSWLPAPNDRVILPPLQP